MAVTFSEGRGLPREFSRGGGYEGFGADFTEQGAVNFMKAISPWDLLTGLFVTKPMAEQAAQTAIAQAQADSIASTAYARSQNLKTILMYGGAAVGVLGLVLLLRRRRPAAVAGYHRRKPRRTRRHR